MSVKVVREAQGGKGSAGGEDSDWKEVESQPEEKEKERRVKDKQWRRERPKERAGGSGSWESTSPGPFSLQGGSGAGLPMTNPLPRVALRLATWGSCWDRFFLSSLFPCGSHHERLGLSLPSQNWVRRHGSGQSKMKCLVSFPFLGCFL